MEENLSDLKDKWQQLTAKLADQFGEEPDLQSIIFLIGVNELGRGPQKFTKDEKMDLMHIATCRLMSQYGYYIYNGVDLDNWPQWTLVEELPPLTLPQQDRLLREAVLSYFEGLDTDEIF